MKHIVIVGGGYAGINTLEHLKKRLGNRLGHDIRMTLIDKQPYHLRKVLLFRRISDKDFNLHILVLTLTFHIRCSRSILLCHHLLLWRVKGTA